MSNKGNISSLNSIKNTYFRIKNVKNFAPSGRILLNPPRLPPPSNRTTFDHQKEKNPGGCIRGHTVMPLNLVAKTVQQDLYGWHGRLDDP